MRFLGWRISKVLAYSFSGFGAALLIWIVTMYWPHSNNSGGLSPDADDSGKKVFIRETSAQELLSYLDGLPPLQDEVIFENNYKGCWVKWTGKFRSASSISSGINVGVEDTANSLFLVYIYFSNEWRGQIQQLRVGDVITYEGELEGVTPGWISLTNGTLISEYGGDIK